MVRFAFAAAAVLITSPTFAAGTVIWNNVDSEMTRAQVEALYPAQPGTSYREHSINIDDVAVTPKCKAESEIFFDDSGKVSEVHLKGNGSLGGRCGDEVLTALASKYGQPMVSSDRNGGILARKGNVYVWTRPDGLTMRYKQYKDGMFGGGGLGAKSWELKYTHAAEAIGL